MIRIGALAPARLEDRHMQVTAVSTPRRPEWRWRISDYAGTIVEESAATFDTIAAAVAAGRQRLMTVSEQDRSDSTPRSWPSRFGRREPKETDRR
jgi:hypothetical protein